MSLIEEALRKTQSQQSAPKAAPTPPTAAGTTPLPTLGSPGPRARIERALMAGGAVLIAAIVVWEAWAYLGPGRSSRQMLSGAPSGPGAQVVQTSLAPPARRPLLQPSLRLTGIVGGPGEPLAIINGAIVRVGEEVAGAKLVELGEDFARVRWRDEDIVLRTNE